MSKVNIQKIINDRDNMPHSPAELNSYDRLINDAANKILQGQFPTNNEQLVFEGVNLERPIKGRKDKKNVEFHCMPPEALWTLAKVYSYGESKYGDKNWERGYEWSRNYDSALRHILAWWGKEELDRESHISHLMHAAWHLFTLYAFQMRGLGLDDRPATVLQHYTAAITEKESNDPETFHAAQ